MATPLDPQEIYLLERFCSLERFEQMRDTWAAMVKHAEDCLQRFMLKLPPDYRNRPLWNQPDAVWGDRVLPNFRDTLQSLNRGYIRLSRGDLIALRHASGVTGGMRAIQMDYSSDWMDEVEAGASDRFWELLGVANKLARPIQDTSNGTWTEGDLTAKYNAIFRNEPLNPPTSWPLYRLNPQIRMKTDERIPRTGIYLPDIDHGFPMLHVKEDGKFGVAIPAHVRKSVDPTGYVPATWTLVERIADTGGGIPDTLATDAAELRWRCEANQACPREGYWFTPAKAGSHRFFKQGEPMPDLKSDYGLTIWQWDEDQSP